MATTPKRAILAGLIEQESCLSITHSRCWNPASRLKSHREEGAGLGQLTRAWTSTGTLRFDKLNELKRKYPKQLSQLSWGNIYTRPDLQIKALVLLTRDLYNVFLPLAESPYQALAFMDAAYNGGERGLINEQRACFISGKCNPKIWFNNVERFCMKSKAPLYGNRSACDINREHVRGTIARSVKYEVFFKGI